MRRAVLLALVLAACHATKRDRDAALDAAIRKTLDKWPVTAVRCPSDRSESPGAKFDCEITFRGGLVEISHVEMQEGSVTVKLTSAVTMGPELSDQLARAETARFGRPIEADCGADVVQVLGAICAITDGGKPGGHVRFQSKDGTAATVPADAPAAERLVRHLEEHALGPVDSVTCTPGGILKVGDQLACDLRMVGGAHTTAHFTLAPDDAASGAFTFDEPLLDLEKLSASLAKTESDENHTAVTVDCGRGVVAQGVDGVVCSYTMGTEHGTLRAKRNADGTTSAEPLS